MNNRAYNMGGKVRCGTQEDSNFALKEFPARQMRTAQMLIHVYTVSVCTSYKCTSVQFPWQLLMFLYNFSFLKKMGQKFFWF